MKWCAIILFLSLLGVSFGDPSKHHGKKNGNKTIKKTKGEMYCYWGTWANNRPGLGAYGVSDLPTKLCTHIVYTFLTLDSEGNLELDEETVVNGKSNKISDLQALKEKNKKLQTIISIGGWNEQGADFSNVANNDTLRAKFINNLLTFITDNKFNGLNLDWEYPADNGGVASDREAFITLLCELKTALHASGYSLGVAVGASAYRASVSYSNITAINECSDRIFLMTYDYHGTWETVTGVNSPLYAQETDDAALNLNVNSTVHNWISSGASPSKLVIGIGVYGKSFNLTSLDNVSTGAPFTGAGAQGPFLQEAGTLSYAEICLYQDQQKWNITEVKDNYVYANYENLWVGYDNAATAAAKGTYAKSMGLAGLSVWAIDYDDYGKNCRTSKVKNPITSAAIKAFNKAKVAKNRS